MPRIPVYEQTQAQTQTLPSPSINPVMPDAGAGIREGVQDMMRSINKAREEANAFRVQDALNKLNSADNTLLYGDGTPETPAQAESMKGAAFQVAKAAQSNREPGAFNFKGEQAYNRPDGKPLAQEYGGKYDAKIAEILDTLGNDEQKRQFTLRASQMKAGFDERVRAHEHQQAATYQKDVWQGTVKTEIENASRNVSDPAALQSSMARIMEATNLYGSAQGLSKKTINQMVLDAQSDMHTVVINRLLEDQKPLAAREYFALHRDAINNKDASAAMKALNVIGIDAQVSSYVDELVGGDLGPQGDDRKPFNIDKMADEVRKKYKDNLAARDVALKQLVERKQFHDAGVQERLQNDNGQTVKLAVSVVEGRYKPTSDSGVFDIEKATEDLRNDPLLADKPDLLQKAIADVTARYNVWVTSSAKRNEERVGRLWAMAIDEQPMDVIRGSDEYKALGDVARKKFEDDLRRDQEQRESLTYARETRDIARENRENGKKEDAIWASAGSGATIDAITASEDFKALPGTIQERLRAQISSARNTEELRKLQEKQRTENANRDAIWNKVLEKQPMSKIRSSPEWKALGGTDRAQLENQIENFRRPNAPSAASKEEIRIEQDANYQMLTEDLDNLVSKSDDEIRALIPYLGRVNANRAIKLKQTAAKDAASVKLDQDMVNRRAFLSGIDAYSADGQSQKGKKVKAQMAQLSGRVEEAILAKQKNLGRPLREEEKRETIDTLLLPGPVRMQQQGGLFGNGSISYENKRLFEVRNAENFGKPGDRDKVIQMYKNKGITPNEDQILRGISALNKK